MFTAIGLSACLTIDAAGVSMQREPVQGEKRNPCSTFVKRNEIVPYSFVCRGLAADKPLIWGICNVSPSSKHIFVSLVLERTHEAQQCSPLHWVNTRSEYPDNQRPRAYDDVANKSGQSFPRRTHVHVQLFVCSSASSLHAMAPGLCQRSGLNQQSWFLSPVRTAPLEQVKH